MTQHDVLTITLQLQSYSYNRGSYVLLYYTDCWQPAKTASWYDYGDDGDAAGVGALSLTPTPNR